MEYRFRKARMYDVPDIQQLINVYAKEGKMLPRSLNELYENIRDYWVVTLDDAEVVGCCALHPVWEDIGEVRSLAIKEGHTGKGLARKLVEICLKEASELSLKRVFALTYIPEFFAKLGFIQVPKEELPHKVWNDCIRCIYFPNCNEVAGVHEVK